MEKAFQHFQQVLRLAPDHSKARDIYRVSDRTVVDIGVLYSYWPFGAHHTLTVLCYRIS